MRRALQVVTLAAAMLAPSVWLAATNSHYTRLQAAALECARTATDFSDSGIAACYTARGLPVPGMLD